MRLIGNGKKTIDKELGLGETKIRSEEAKER